jgi:hypothetical protein
MRTMYIVVLADLVSSCEHNSLVNSFRYDYVSQGFI